MKEDFKTSLYGFLSNERTEDYKCVCDVAPNVIVVRTKILLHILEVFISR